jgi:hypothetical protein
MFVEFNATEEQRKLFKKNDLNAWKTFKIGIEGKCQKELKDILEYPTIILRKKDDKRDYMALEEENDSLIIVYHSYDCKEIIDFIAKKSEHTQFSFGSYIDDKKEERIQVIISNNLKKDIITNWNLWFRNYINNNHYARGVMPCDKKYNVLRVKDDFFPYGGYDYTFPILVKQYPIMICPYIRKYRDSDLFFRYPESLELDMSEKMLEMAFENRYDQ